MYKHVSPVSLAFLVLVFVFCNNAVIIPLLSPFHQFFDINTPNDVFNKLPTSMRSLADQLLDGDSVLSKLKVGSLNHSYTPDQKLLAELQLVDHVLKTVSRMFI